MDSTAQPVRITMGSTPHPVRQVASTPTRWNAPRCQSSRHRPHHASPLRTVVMRGVQGGRDLPSATVHRVPGGAVSGVVADDVKGKRRKIAGNS